MNYQERTIHELKNWRRQMLRRPSVMNRLSKKLQDKLNSLIPEKVHKGITVTIKNMVRAVLFGAKWTTRGKNQFASLVARDIAADQKISFYQGTAATEGAITGAGGILLGLADFPILLTIKVKLLFELASVYGYSTKDYKERLFILHIFQLAFSSHQQRRKVFLQMENWDARKDELPDDINDFDWRIFQQEYRDYIDLAKMAQLVPIIGAPVGAVANYQLVKKLGRTAKNAYHLRWAEKNMLMSPRRDNQIDEGDLLLN